jgi:hypothetical protein
MSPSLRSDATQFGPSDDRRASGGHDVSVRVQVGKEVSVEQGYEAAKIIAINLISSLKGGDACVCARGVCPQTTPAYVTHAPKPHRVRLPPPLTAHLIHALMAVRRQT